MQRGLLRLGMEIFITTIFFLLLFMGLKDQNAFWAKILRRISAFIGIGIPLTILFFALLVLLSPLSEEEYVCNGFRPNLTTCFTVKKGDSFYDPGISEDGFIKGGTYFKIGEDEPYSGCAIYRYDYFDGHSGSMCFENGKPNGVWSYWKKNQYSELEKDVCYIKGKKQRNLSKCD
jgi:hypothetical protein